MHALPWTDSKILQRRRLSLSYAQSSASAGRLRESAAAGLNRPQPAVLLQFAASAASAAAFQMLSGELLHYTMPAIVLESRRLRPERVV